MVEMIKRTDFYLIGTQPMNRISEHDRNTKRRGPLNRPTHVGFARNPLCGDEVWLDLDVVGDAIRQARFHGQGGVVSQACASMLCEGIEGKPVDDVLASTAEEVMDFAIRELTINRQRCALTAWDALLRALLGANSNSVRGLPACHVEAATERGSPDPVAKPP